MLAADSSCPGDWLQFLDVNTGSSNTGDGMVEYIFIASFMGLRVILAACQPDRTASGIVMAMRLFRRRRG